MELKNYNVNFFLLLLLGVSVLTFFIFKPFFIAILLAAILAVVFQTPFKFFLKITRNSQRISAFLTALFGMIIFSGLFIGIIGLVANEVSSLYKISNIENGGSQKYVDNVVNKVNTIPALKSFGLDNLINKDSIAKSVSQISQGAVGIFQKTYQSVANFLFLTFVMFFSLYYFLISGKELVKQIMYLSPLRDAHEKMLIENFISMSRATIKGNLIIAIVQGCLGAILFSAVGIHSAVIWGVIMMFCSVLPGPGTALVWIPVGVAMIALGNVWQGITIFAIGATVISLVDNFLSPKLIGKDTQMHPLIVFFAIIGGISMFGFLGFIIGPIIIALFLTLWQIYAVEFKKQLKEYNS
jgi:predicted PurR-regulated permease PerM